MFFILVLAACLWCIALSTGVFCWVVGVADYIYCATPVLNCNLSLKKKAVNIVCFFLSVNLLEFPFGSSDDGAGELRGSKQPFKEKPEEERARLLARFHLKITRDRLSFGSVDIVFM